MLKKFKDKKLDDYILFIKKIYNNNFGFLHYIIKNILSFIFKMLIIFFSPILFVYLFIMDFFTNKKLYKL